MEIKPRSLKGVGSLGLRLGLGMCGFGSEE